MKLFDDDALAIATIWQEAEGEPYDAKVALGELIRERMRRKYNSDGTVAGTVGRRYQFSSFNDDATNNARFIASLKLDLENPMVQDCMTAWYASANSHLSKGAVLCANLSALNQRPPWARDDKLVAKVGRTSFYKD